jgi:hypothetical protein
MSRMMRTQRGLDRLVNFSDATLAITITLLLLPLVIALVQALVLPGSGVWGLLRRVRAGTEACPHRVLTGKTAEPSVWCRDSTLVRDRFLARFVER